MSFTYTQKFFFFFYCISWWPCLQRTYLNAARCWWWSTVNGPFLTWKETEICLCVCVSLWVRKDGNVNAGIGAKRVRGCVRPLEDNSFPVWLSETKACLRPGPKFTAAELSHPLPRGHLPAQRCLYHLILETHTHTHTYSSIQINWIWFAFNNTLCH